MLPVLRTSFGRRRGSASTAGLLALLFMGVAAACGSGSSNDSTSCTPGQQSFCACSGGTMGTQVCSSDGSGYGACDCSGPLDATTGSSSGSGGSSSGGSSGGSSGSGSGSSSGSSGSSSGGDATDSDARDVQGDRVEKDVTNESGGSDGGTCILPTNDAGAGGTINWAKNFGISGTTTAEAVAIDPASGDIVVAGYLGGSVDFGGGVLTSKGDASDGASDAFVARFTSAGKYKWAKVWGNGFLVAANSVAFGSSGSVILGGELRSRGVNFGCGELAHPGKEDLFLVDLDSADKCSWSKSFGTKGASQGLTTVATDPSGNVLIAGAAKSLDFGSGAEQTGFYIAKYDPTGGYLWSDAFPASTSYGGPYLAVDGQGNSLFVGSFLTTIDLGGGKLTSAGSSDIFVAKFDASGSYQWAKQYGDAAEQDVRSVAADACGNIVVTGDFAGTINFGTGALKAVSDAANIFLAKVGPTGRGGWAELFDSTSSVDALGAGSVAVDGEGRVTITSVLNGSVTYGGALLHSVGDESVVIASFDATGAYRWSYAGGPPSTAIGSGAAYFSGVAASGENVVLAGGFETAGSTLVLDGKKLTAASDEDVFIASFAP